MRTDASHAHAQLLADVTVLQTTHRGVSPATHPVPRAKELIRRVTQEPGIWRDLARDVADPEAAWGVVVWARQGCGRRCHRRHCPTGPAAAVRWSPIPSRLETPRDGASTVR